MEVRSDGAACSMVRDDRPGLSPLARIASELCCSLCPVSRRGETKAIQPGGLAITRRKAVVNVRGSDRSMTDGDTQLMQIADNVADGI
jgi:hypothetical protein